MLSAVDVAQPAGDVVFDGVRYRFADAGDEACIEGLLRDNPMASWVAISTEHAPSYFASTELFGARRTMIARSVDDDSPVGMASYVIMPVYVDGREVCGGYLGELRVLPRYRNRLRVVRNGYRAIAALSRGVGNNPVWFTSIASENSAAKRLLEANLKDMPTYTPVGNMHTRALSVNKGKHRNTMRQATRADVGMLAEFHSQHACRHQYAPVVTEAWLASLDGRHGLSLDDLWLLEKHGEVQASFAIWDQQALKQTVVRGYRFPLAQVRRVYNAYARLSGRVALPGIGERIPYAFIAFLAMQDDSELSAEVISSALALVKARQLPIAMLGTNADSSLAPLLDQIPQELYETTIYSVSWEDPASPALPTDGRVVQPEIAIL